MLYHMQNQCLSSYSYIPKEISHFHTLNFPHPQDDGHVNEIPMSIKVCENLGISRSPSITIIASSLMDNSVFAPAFMAFYIRHINTLDSDNKPKMLSS